MTGDGVPLEQVSADNADKDAAAAAGDDLDFGMMKKKKKSKKGAFDLEAFEKEIVGDEGGAEKAGGAGGEEDEDLGDDPFRQEGEDEEEKEAEETWHGTDRDYTYQEVSRAPEHERCAFQLTPGALHSCSAGSSPRCAHRTRRWQARRRSTRWCRRRCCATAARRRCLPTLSRSASACTASQTTSSSTSSPSWARRAPSTVRNGSSSRVASSRSRLSTCCGDTSVSLSRQNAARGPPRPQTSAASRQASDS